MSQEWEKKKIKNIAILHALTKKRKTKNEKKKKRKRKKEKKAARITKIQNARDFKHQCLKKKDTNVTITSRIKGVVQEVISFFRSHQVC